MIKLIQLFDKSFNVNLVDLVIKLIQLFDKSFNC